MIATLASGVADYSPISQVQYALWFLIAPVLVVMMLCIHDSTPAPRRILSSIGVAFILVYTVLASFGYFTQLTVMRFSLIYGQIQGLALFNNANLHSMVWELEALNYCFQGLAFLFVAPLFRGDQLGKAISVSLKINAVNGLFAMVAFAFDLSWTLLVGTLVIWVIFLPLTTGLIAIYFKREMKRDISPQDREEKQDPDLLRARTSFQEEP